VAVDATGNVFVADAGNLLVRKISPSGQVSTLAGAVGQFGSVDGVGSAAEFESPSSLTVDSVGNVFMMDGSTIRKITPLGLVTTLAGVPLESGSQDGTGAAARFDYLAALAVDGTGAIYIADALNNTIRKATLAFSTQPASQSVNAGSFFVLTVVLPDNAAYQYQWQFNGVDLADGNGILGSKGPQLVLTGVASASAGDYACVVTAPGLIAKSGTANLVVESSTSPGTLTSVSSRAFVGTGDDILIGGFYITGSTSATVFVQAIGPALSLAPYNVTGTLQHPALTIHQSQNGKDVVLYSNTGWGSSPVLLAAASAAYAQPVLTPGSADSEVLLTLPPGGYTAEVTGADGGTGVALCAIYQLP
jgi:hypothetical protein